MSYKPLDSGNIISIHRNITELKEREASLAAAKEAAEAARADAERTRQSMQTVLDNMNEAVQLFDKDFNIEFVNRQALGVLRISARRSAGPALPASTACRYMAKRGDYGPDVNVDKVVAERAARIRDPKGSRHVRRTGTAASSSSRSIRCPTAECSRSVTMSPRSSTAKRRCSSAADILKLIS